MFVKLIAYTPSPEGIVSASARGCYSEKPSYKLLDTPIPNAHGSCFEHVSFTFSVEGVSRVTTHQLVRHRVGTAFSQQSQRYVNINKTWENIVIPPKVSEAIREWDELEEFFSDVYNFARSTPTENEDIEKAYYDYVKSLDKLLKALDKHDIPSEDKRYFIPQGTASNITVTMNARELQHFCGLRRCKRAQWEIRELADKFAELVQEECPELCKHLNLGAQCEQLGYCPEHKSCKKNIEVKE